MASVRLTDDEWALFRDEPADMLKVYLELRRRMDFSNATVGRHGRLSEQAIKEVLHVPARRGRQSEVPTRKRVRYVMSALERMGAIRPTGQYVFHLPHAPSDDSAQTRKGQGGAKVGPEVRPESTNENCRQDNGLNGNAPEGGAGGLSEVDSRWGQPPGSGTGKTTSPDGDASTAGPPQCPHQQIIAAWHEILPELPQVRVWNDQRKKHLQSRWREDKRHQSLEFWRGLFAYMRDSPFLMGQVEKRDGPPFRATLDWVVKPTNFAKVLERKYHDG